MCVYVCVCMCARAPLYFSLFVYVCSVSKNVYVFFILT